MESTSTPDLRNGSHGPGVDPPGGLEQSPTLNRRHRLSELFEGKIIQQEVLHFQFEAFPKLGEGVHLQLQGHQMTGASSGPLYRGAYSPGQGDVIIFDQNSVVEAETMVPSLPPQRTAYFSKATRPGVVLRVAAKRAPVPSIIWTRLWVVVAIPLKVPEKIECGALPSEDCPSGSFHLEKVGALFHHIAVLHPKLEFHGGI